MNSGGGNPYDSVLGFPIRKSPDQSLVGDSPRHIAASHVLHRLLMPRHPPYALKNLTTQDTQSRTCNSETTTSRPTTLTTNTHPQRSRSVAIDARVHCAVPKTQTATTHQPDRPHLVQAVVARRSEDPVNSHARFLRTQQCAQPARTSEPAFPLPPPRAGGTDRPTRSSRVNSQCSTSELRAHAPADNVT